jgi:GxxExxY protein
MPQPIPARTNAIARQVVDAAYRVHTALGPGLLETVYEVCLVYEINKRGIDTRRQVLVPVVYDDVQLDAGFRIDVLVADTVLIELKAVDALLPVHTAQVLTYLKLTGHRLGFLMNFNVPRIKDGIQRLVM